MSKPRPSAWALIVTVAVAITAIGGPAAVLAREPALEVPTVADPNTVCTPGQLPTRWQDEFHPPDTVRVLRSKGPNAGRVETVDLWKYVGVVVRAEYSSGKDKPDPWMRMGALTVKQYAWYKAMFWGGGRITFTNPDGVTTTTQCYDLKDTTADQIYKDVKPDPNNPGQWIPANVPTAANLKAMRETWHVSLRKWMPDKLKSRLFLTGYRSGKQVPCGNDSTGFKIYQKSLRDCGVKQMRFEETLRRYFEDRLEIVDTRGRDMVGDSGTWRGDLGVVNTGNGSWRLYNSTATGFGNAADGTFSGLGDLLGQGVGETTGASNSGDTDTPRAGDERLFADLVMLVNDGGKKLKVARSTGSGFAPPAATAAPSDSEMLVVGDFNGDRLADAGLLATTSPGNAKLMVMRGQGDDTFAAAVDWWSGPLDLGNPDVFVAAGDVNGDGKADLVMRDATDGGAYRVAPSYASCTSFSNWGPCLVSQGNGLDAASVWLVAPSWAVADARNTVSDYDRDGRDDVVVVTPNGSGSIKVVALRAKVDGGFADPVQLWSGSGSVADTVAVGAQLDFDGLGDLALFVKDGSGTDLVWLRSVGKGASPASMTTVGSPMDASVPWSDAQPF